MRGQVFTEPKSERGGPIRWMPGAAANHAAIRGTSRKKGSVQKDWAVIEDL